MRLELATPQRLVLSLAVRSLQAPGADGYFGILPGHAPMLSLLGAGELSYEPEAGPESDPEAGKSRRYLIGGGFMEVTPDQVTLLADVAELPHEINAGQARQDLAAGEAVIRSAAPDADYEAALRQIALAQARLALAEKS